MVIDMKLEEIGSRIRLARKRAGLTIKQLAQKLGVSPITLQRIETAKSSPSVILLSGIADAVNKPIFSFFESKTKSFVSLKSKQQRVISSPTSKVKLIGPRNMITDNIIVTQVELKKGQSIDTHTAQGIEWGYTLEGKCEFNLDGRIFHLEVGDAISFDGRLKHVVTALEDLKFIGIYVEDKK
jgi:transcriptional regulator with XRE-family HTH domain